MVTLWKQISRRTIHLIPGEQIQFLHTFPAGFAMGGHRPKSLAAFSVVLFAAETTYFYPCMEQSCPDENQDLCSQADFASALCSCQDTSPGFPDPLPHLFKSFFLNQS